MGIELDVSALAKSYLKDMVPKDHQEPKELAVYLQAKKVELEKELTPGLMCMNRVQLRLVTELINALNTSK